MHPIDFAHLFADIENDRFVAHWDELHLQGVFQQRGAIPMQGGATR
jgi:hypothetical protein